MHRNLILLFILAIYSSTLVTKLLKIVFWFSKHQLAIVSDQSCVDHYIVIQILNHNSVVIMFIVILNLPGFLKLLLSAKLVILVLEIQQSIRYTLIQHTLIIHGMPTFKTEVLLFVSNVHAFYCEMNTSSLAVII